MCKYCKGSDNWIIAEKNGEPEYLDMRPLTSTLKVSLQDRKGIQQKALFYKINYCPMCGRKLNG